MLIVMEQIFSNVLDVLKVSKEMEPAVYHVLKMLRFVEKEES